MEEFFVNVPMLGMSMSDSNLARARFISRGHFRVTWLFCEQPSEQLANRPAEHVRNCSFSLCAYAPTNAGFVILK